MQKICQLWLKAVDKEVRTRKGYEELMKEDKCESEVQEESQTLLQNRSEASLYKKLLEIDFECDK